MASGTGADKKRAGARKAPAKRSAGAQTTAGRPRKKDPAKLIGRFSLDFVVPTRQPAAAREPLAGGGWRRQPGGRGQPGAAAAAGAGRARPARAGRPCRGAGRCRPGQLDADGAAGGAQRPDLRRRAGADQRPCHRHRAASDRRQHDLHRHQPRRRVAHAGRRRHLDRAGRRPAVDGHRRAGDRRQQPERAVRGHRRGQCAALQHRVRAEFGAGRVPGRGRAAQHRRRQHLGAPGGAPAGQSQLLPHRGGPQRCRPRLRRHQPGTVPHHQRHRVDRAVRRRAAAPSRPR